jgi:hypothetical protein
MAHSVLQKMMLVHPTEAVLLDRRRSSSICAMIAAAGG